MFQEWNGHVALSAGACQKGRWLEEFLLLIGDGEDGGGLSGDEAEKLLLGGPDDTLLCSSSDVVSVDEAAWEYNGRTVGWSWSIWSQSVTSWDGHSRGANNCTCHTFETGSMKPRCTIWVI